MTSKTKISLYAVINITAKEQNTRSDMLVMLASLLHTQLTVTWRFLPHCVTKKFPHLNWLFYRLDALPDAQPTVSKH